MSPVTGYPNLVSRLFADAAKVLVAKLAISGLLGVACGGSEDGLGVTAD